jgi:hypothetical protein
MASPIPPVRVLRARTLAGIVASLTVLGAAGPAHAAAGTTSGWWASSPLVVAPDVGDGQLLVQGGPSDDEPLAYAGISFLLEEGEEPQSLTLTVAEGSASTPAAELRLCALDAPATPAAGEPADGAPAPDCATEVVAAPSGDGATYTFDVGALAGDDSLDVAVLPGQQATRVVLEAPDTSALTAAAPITPIGSGSGSPGAPAPATPSSSGSSSGGAGPSTAGPSVRAPSATPSVSIPSGSTSASNPPAATDGEEEAAAPLRPPTPFEPAVSVGGGSDGASVPVAVLFVGLAGLAAALWTMAGREPEVVTDGQTLPT